MVNTSDYEAYLKQNEELLNLLKQNHSYVYDRFADVLLTLNHISDRVKKYKKIEEELEVVFDVGFSFFHEQWEIIGMIYEKYFKRDIILFSSYASIINYLLYLDDLEETLKEKEKLSDEAKTNIKELYELLEQKLILLLPIEQTLLDDCDLRLAPYIPDGTLTTVEIYAMIVEELQL
jgi:hypothetical protein